jgi:hypothetical protein
MEILDKVKINNAINNGISLDNAHISIKRNIQELLENHNSNSIDDMIKYVYGVLNIINHPTLLIVLIAKEKQISVLYK